MNKIKTKKAKGRMTILKVMAYKDCNVYIRKFDNEIFVYDLVFENQIYSQYLIMKPAKGETKLTNEEIQATVNLLWVGAETTIDQLMGVELSEEAKESAQAFIDSQESNSLVN